MGTECFHTTCRAKNLNADAVRRGVAAMQQTKTVAATCAESVRTDTVTKGDVSDNGMGGVAPRAALAAIPPSGQSAYAGCRVLNY